jgi:hypothetical protein
VGVSGGEIVEDKTGAGAEVTGRVGIALILDLDLEWDGDWMVYELEGTGWREIWNAIVVYISSSRHCSLWIILHFC